MAALVAAGSARMTTRAPVIVFAVSLGGDPDDLAAGGDQAGDELLPVGVLGALVPAVGDDDQDARGAGRGEAERAVEGADGGGEVLVPVGGGELGDPGGDRAGVGDRADAAARR